jgi:hypothetical protein
LIEEKAINIFKSFKRNINKPKTPILINLHPKIIFQIKFEFLVLNKENRKIPYAPIFKSNAAKTIDPTVGAST